MTTTKKQLKELFPHLELDFLDLMNKLGEYGFQKHGDASFQAKRLRGEGRGDSKRLSSGEILIHAADHASAYLRDEVHDHFGDLEMQLVAVAFNAMMEFYCLQRDRERENEIVLT